MEREKFIKIFEDMIPEHIEGMKKSLNRLLSSGAIDLEGISNENCREVKKAFCAILQNESLQYKPNYSNNKKDLKDIENYKNIV